jgi:hypothetical protein
MGDGGSLTLGFLVGALAIRASSKTATGLTLMVPLLLIGVPLFDTLMAIARRKLNGRGIGEGDRGHIHHRLQDRGLSRPQALLAISGLSLVMAAAALTTAVTESELVGLMICLTVLTTLVAGRIFGHHETLLLFRHLRELGALLLDTSGVVRTRFLLARMDAVDPARRLEIWDQICHRVEQMGATSLQLRCTSSDGDVSENNLTWESERSVGPEEQATWQFAYCAERPDGVAVTLKTFGRAPASKPTQRLDDLFRLFARVCQELPLPSERDEDAATLPLLVPGAQPAERRAA